MTLTDAQRKLMVDLHMVRHGWLFVVNNGHGLADLFSAPPRHTYYLIWAEIVALYRLTLDGKTRNTPPRHQACSRSPNCCAI